MARYFSAKCVLLSSALLLAAQIIRAAPAPDKVVLQLKWTMQFQSAGYFAALEKGFYREAGLDVDIRETVQGRESIREVLDGKADFGVGTTDLLLLREAGEPVVVLAVIFQHSPLALLVRKDSGIGSLSDLKGRKVMIEPHSAELLAYFLQEGLKSDKYIHLPHSRNIDDLANGKADAMSVYLTDELFALKSAGVDYLLFSGRSAGIDFYGDNLFTTASQIEKHPQRVKAFRAASLKGWEYAMQHQQEIIELMHARYGQRHSLEALRFEAGRMAPLFSGLVSVGYMHPGRWRYIADTYAEQAMLKPGFDLEGFLYDADQRPDRGWLFEAMAVALIVILVASFLVLRVHRINHQLQRGINAHKRMEAALRESEERFSNLVAQAPLSIQILDTSGKTLQVNRAFEELWGVPFERMGDYNIFKDKQFAEIGVRSCLERAFKGETVDFPPVEFMPRTKDLSGHKRVVHAIAYPIKDKAGVVREVTLIHQDITQHKLAEDALAKSHEMLSNLARLVPGVIYQYRMFPDGRSAFSYTSPGMNDIFELTSEAVREDASAVFGRLHPEDAAKFAAAIRESALSLQMFHCEFRVVLPRQGLRWRWSQAQPERMADGGTLWYGIVMDITDRKQSETQARALLEESNQSRLSLLGIIEDETRAEADLKRLATAIGQAAEIIVMTDAQGVIQYANPAFEAVTGYTRDEAIGQSPRLLKSGQQDAEFYRQLWETISSGNVWHGRFVNRKKNGALYTEDATISPVRDAAGGIANYVAVKRDITEDLILQTQLTQAQKMESVGRLAGGVAHDFNNILQAILGNAQLVLEQADMTEQTRIDLEEIQNAAQRASALTRQLLAFASKQVIVPQMLDLNEIVGGILKMLRRLIGENIELIWTPCEGLWPVKMDPSQVDQIMANLCVNARDAINGIGTVHITVGNTRVDEINALRHEGFMAGEYVLLMVSDNGCGMDEETRAKIFEPFFTTKAMGKGTGLGLATVYGIIRQNGGHISVYSENGKGTTFRIYLPRFTGDEVQKTPESPAQTVLRGSETILLVEDDTTILTIVGRMLRGLGYTVLAAATPEAALRMAGEYSGAIELLLTDVVMPGMNGRELAKRLQVKQAGLKCLFMSGFTADIIASQGVLDAGIQFIQKPFALADLASKMRETLAGRAAASEPLETPTIPVSGQ